MADLVQCFSAPIDQNILFVIAALAGLICADPLARATAQGVCRIPGVLAAARRQAENPYSLDDRRIVFSACVLRFGASWQALYAIGLVNALIVLTWIDFDHGVLPDAITLPLVWAGLLVNLNGVFVEPHLGRCGGRRCICLSVRRFFTRFSGLRAMRAWGAAILSCSLLWAHGQALPFGPHLALAGVVVLLSGYF